MKRLLATLCFSLSLAGSAQADLIDLAPTKTGNVSVGNFSSPLFLTLSYGNPDRNNVGLMSFDLSQVSAASGFQATLWLYHTANAAEGVDFNIRQLQGDFAQGLSKWADLPASSDEAASFTLGSGSGHWYSVDVTAFTGQALADNAGQIGFLLERGDEAAPYATFSAVNGSLGFLGKLYAPHLELSGVTAAVPEPGSFALLVAGLAVLPVMRRRASAAR